MQWKSCSYSASESRLTRARTDHYSRFMTWDGSDVVAFELSGHEGEFETGGGRFHVERSGGLSTDDIPELQRLWKELPEGEVYRCHTPRIGFEVRRGGELELRAALC